MQEKSPSEVHIAPIIIMLPGLLFGTVLSLTLLSGTPAPQDGAPASMLRRHALIAARSAVLGMPLAALAGGVPEGMKTSESYTNLQQISPETTGTLGAGTMSSRSRPVTGVVLLEEVTESGSKNAPTVSAELVLDGGVAATVAFQAEQGYPLIRGMFYDVEVRSKASDGAFVQVAKLPEGKSIEEVNDKFFTKSVFSTEGRFGAYGGACSCSLRGH